jgi:leader peptidase (prepilin peptidase)/N-methyltransferase
MVMTSWSWVIGLVLGATIGSFLNVVIYRLPRGISLSKPAHSFCPSCKHSLLIFPDMVPLLSWLFMGAHCRYCKAKISPRYFFVELITGVIWAGIWYQYLIADIGAGRSDLNANLPTAVFYALGASALVVAIFVDLELYLIPDQVNAFLLFVGFAYNIWLIAVHDPRAFVGPWPSSVLGALVGVAALWGIALFGRVLFRKDAMGHGDIKMARGIGAILFMGPALLSFALAVVFGAVLGILQIVFFKPKSDEDDSPLPPPESYGSLLKCGVGYVLCQDVVGLFIPRLYKAWFGEDPFTPVQDMGDFKVELTMIPFGPYLALGAIVATIFQAPLLDLWNAYIHSVSGRLGLLEHWQGTVGLFIGTMRESIG